MTPPLPRSSRLSRWLLTAGVPAAAATALFSFEPAHPCGPFFPPQLLTKHSKLAVSAPTGDMLREFDRIAAGIPKGPASVASDDPQTASYDTDVADLRKALDEGGLAPTTKAGVLRGYQAARQAFRRYAGPSTEWAKEQAAKGKQDPLPEWAKTMLPPEGTPPEFAEYLRGAVAYRFMRDADARAAWEKVLALPPAERRYRSTWAAFMIGRSLRERGGTDAAAAFAKVRALCKAGFHDSLGLGATSLGEEGRTLLQGGAWSQAILRYLEQYRAGDQGAASSIRMTIRGMFAASTPQTLMGLAKDPLTRRTVTAFVVSNGGPPEAQGLPPKPQLRAWLDAVEAVAAQDVDGADRLAWAAYQNAEFAIARRWAERAPADSMMAKWITAKLLLRDGKLAQAATLLAEVVKGFAETEKWHRVADVTLNGADFSPQARAQADLGGVRLCQKDYEGALDALLRSGFWADAAFVAERVLTLDELRSYVDRSWPEPSAAGPNKPTFGPTPTAKPTVDDDDSYGRGWGSMPAKSVAFNIRGLLARRMVRSGQVAAARPYIGAKLRGDLDALQRHAAQSQDPARAPLDRARSLFAAARITRKTGLELRGTEIEPDHAMYGANFDGEGPSKWRATAVADAILPSSVDERERLAKHAPETDLRFHYRYVAADMAHRAALMFPKNNEEAALMLCVGGSWLRARNPRAADKLYKALVRRNRNVPMGRKADAARWFPARCEK